MISISQKKYAKDILTKFNMEECNISSTPMEYGQKLSKEKDEKRVNESLYRSLVGSLMYLTATRPDIMFAVSKISRFMEDPKVSHWEARKRILRYIKGTLNHGIIYERSPKGDLTGFSDSDFGGDMDDSKSTSGFVFNLGSGIVSWQSKNQNVVALSSAEAEYISLSSAGCQSLWIRAILKELYQEQKEATMIFCNNKSAIALSKNPVYHGKSKHIRIKYHFIRELVNRNEVIIEHCGTKDQVADIFTKALQVGVFNHLKKGLGVRNV